MLSRVLPWWLSGLRMCLQCGRSGYDPWVRKITQRRERQPTPVFLSGDFHGQKSLVGYSPWGSRETNTTELLTHTHTYTHTHTHMLSILLLELSAFTFGHVLANIWLEIEVCQCLSSLLLQLEEFFCFLFVCLYFKHTVTDTHPSYWNQGRSGSLHCSENLSPALVTSCITSLTTALMVMKLMLPGTQEEARGVHISASSSEGHLWRAMGEEGGNTGSSGQSQLHEKPLCPSRCQATKQTVHPVSSVDYKVSSPQGPKGSQFNKIALEQFDAVWCNFLHQTKVETRSLFFGWQSCQILQSPSLFINRLFGNH